MTLDFALARLAGVIDEAGGLSRAHARRTSTALGGLVHSQRVLLALTQAGICREDAYRSCSATRWRPGPGSARPRAATSATNLDADPEVAGRVPSAILDEAMRPEAHLRNIDRLFERVFGEKSAGDK